jgi:predicted RNA-binding protein with RPS1 domain
MTIDETQAPKSDIAAHQPEEKPAVVSDAQPPELAAEEHIAPVTPEPTIVAESAPEAAQPTETPAVVEAPVAPVAAETPVATEPVVAEVAHAPAVEEPKVEEPKLEVPKAEAPKVEAPAITPAAASDGVATADDGDLFEQYMNALEGGDKADSNKGDRVEATVIQVEHDRVFVDLGTKAEGVIPLSELSDKNPTTAIGFVKPGDKLQVVVLNPTGSEGNPTVSRKRAEFEEQWDRIIKAFEDGSPINAMVVDRVKGGLVVDVGVRGFVPATHVGNGKLRNIDKFVGQTLTLKVIELERERKKVVLSNRQAEEETRGAAKDEIFKNIKVGDTLTGTVRRLTDYGAFIDLGGVDGLLHISEMSWARISHPKEIFKEGQEIPVMVLRLDQNVGKISLGHRQVLPDPWNLIKSNYKIGQKMMVKIGRLVPAGAFVKLEEGAEAFLPLSEISYRRIKKPEEVIAEAQEVEVQVIDLRADERRMVLSMRALAPGESRPPGGYNMEEEYRKPRTGGGPGGNKSGRRRQNDDSDDSRRGTATGGATIGERLGMLKGLLKNSEEE